MMHDELIREYVDAMNKEVDHDIHDPHKIVTVPMKVTFEQAFEWLDYTFKVKYNPAIGPYVPDMKAIDYAKLEMPELFVPIHPREKEGVVWLDGNCVLEGIDPLLDILFSGTSDELMLVTLNFPSTFDNTSRCRKEFEKYRFHWMSLAPEFGKDIELRRKQELDRSLAYAIEYAEASTQ